MQLATRGTSSGSSTADSLFLPKTATAYTDYEYKLKPTITPAENEPLIQWKSSDLKAVKVSDDGSIKGLRKGGTATIGDKKATCKVKVATTAFKFKTKTMKMEVGKSLGSLAGKPSLTPADFPDKKLTWTSSNEHIVSVSENGTITAKDTGKAKITDRTVTNKSDSFKYSDKLFTQATAKPNAELAIASSIIADGLCHMHTQKSSPSIEAALYLWRREPDLNR